MYLSEFISFFFFSLYLCKDNLGEILQCESVRDKLINILIIVIDNHSVMWEIFSLQTT